MLFGWVLLAQILFARLKAPTAALLVMLGGVMFLPELVEFDLPGLPPYNKKNAISLSLMLGALYACRGRLLAARPGTGYDLITLLMMASALVTAATNGDPLVYGPRVIAANGRAEAISMVVETALFWGVPFFLGRVFFRTPRDLRNLALGLVIACLVYSLLILFEVRFAPRLHKWVYGHHPAQFRNMIRGGGWKPMVFMGSGLAVGLFVASSMVAAAALASTRATLAGFRLSYTLPYFALLVLLCRSYSSMVYGFVLAPCAYWMPIRQLRILVLLLVVLVVSYPVTRTLDIFPTDTLVTIAELFSADRAHSLSFRFENEDLLLAKAQERLVFGWGMWGRSRIYDPDYFGRSIAVTDGYWIIVLGSRGLVGWCCAFGLLLLPLVRVCRRLHLIRGATDRRIMLGLCLVVLAYTIDLLPNGFWSPVPIVVAGALAGRMGNLSSRPRRVRVPSPPDSPPSTTSVLRA